MDQKITKNIELSADVLSKTKTAMAENLSNMWHYTVLVKNVELTYWKKWASEGSTKHCPVSSQIHKVLSKQPPPSKKICLTFEVPIVMLWRVNKAFFDVMPCLWASAYQHFKGTVSSSSGSDGPRQIAMQEDRVCYVHVSKERISQWGWWWYVLGTV